MASVSLLDSHAFARPSNVGAPSRTIISSSHRPPTPSFHPHRRPRFESSECSVNPRSPAYALATASVNPTIHYVPQKSRTYTVGDFMTKKEDSYVVKATTTVEEAWEALAEKRLTGFPVVDGNWELVGVISDYDLLALDSISGGQADISLFPDVNSSWNTFNEIQKLLGKAHGKVVGDLMTHTPLVVHESTNLGEAAWLLLETKHRQLPVVDGDKKLVGIVTRGNVIRAALQIKQEKPL